MIKVYILDSNTEEICHKGISQITDEEFKLFGTECSLKDYEHHINFNDSVFNQSNDYIRFIEDGETKD
jgi:hypothetical protein